MNIGIIVYSYTGNTLMVAQMLKNAFEKKGHHAQVEEIVIDEQQYSKTGDIVFQNTPDITRYELLIFGSPVRGGNVSPMMEKYINQLPSCQDRTLACFVTHFFPFVFMGGSQALTSFIKIISKRGIKLYATGIISWTSGKRERKIDEYIIKCLHLNS